MPKRTKYLTGDQRYERALLYWRMASGGASNAALARKMGISPQNLRRVVGGGNPKLHTLVTLAEAIERRLDLLVYR